MAQADSPASKHRQHNTTRQEASTLSPTCGAGGGAARRAARRRVRRCVPRLCDGRVQRQSHLSVPGPWEASSSEPLRAVLGAIFLYELASDPRTAGRFAGSPPNPSCLLLPPHLRSCLHSCGPVFTPALLSSHRRPGSQATRPWLGPLMPASTRRRCTRRRPCSRVCGGL